MCVCVCVRESVCLFTDWSVEGGVDLVRERDDCCGLH